MAHLKLGKFEDANYYYDKVLEILHNPTVAILGSKAKSLFELAEYYDAINYYDKELAIVPASRSAREGRKWQFELEILTKSR
jgi:tetratricopeptide (TPR) repeat protein